MDYDLISNISLLFDGEDYDYSQTTWIIFPHEIAYALISFVSLCAHGLVIFTIVKNKSMRTPTNLFLLNIVVLDALYIIISPANLLLPLHNMFSEDFYLIAYNIENTLQSGNCLLLIFFSFDCCVKPKRYLLFVIGTWIITVQLCIVFVVLYKLDHWTYAAFYTVFFSFALLTIVNIISWIASWNNVNICPFRLNIITVYVSSWVTSWMCLFIWTFSHGYQPILQMISEICAAFGYGYGIYNILVLAYLDKKFKMHFLQAIQCSKYVYNHPGDEDVIDIPEDQDRTTSEDFQEATTM